MTKADLRGKWALVTGASRGIGRQVSLGLADQGCNLVLHSRATEGTDTLAQLVRQKGCEVFQVGAELADSGQVEAMIATVRASVPQVDILYNNAAMMTPYRVDWMEVPVEDLRVSFEVNVNALVRLCHAFLPGMKERKWGRIVNVSSGIAKQPELIAYAISKAAVDKFVFDTVPKLRNSGVMMNLLDPGWLRTDLGGPRAPGSVESVLPGALVPVLLDEEVQGQLFRAQDFVGQTL